jgi:simple sugar transport system permease protein
LVVLLIGESPIAAVRVLLTGAFGYGESLGYTLFYATNFIFTGLAVSLAFHAGLFNIGGEGQAYLGGLGAALVALFLAPTLGVVALPLAVMAAAAFGAAWAFVPGWLQARRGSHVVITTILLNFVAGSLMTYLLVNVLIRPGQQAPETATFLPAVRMPQLWEIGQALGLTLERSPLNLSLVLALVCAVAVWLFVFKSRRGYELRVVGRNERAAVYGGISPATVTMLAMALSGALAGLLAVNEILGQQHRLLLGFTSGAGFVGIAVALMGRNHPVGIVLAAVLFGALWQGGAELAFELPRVSRDLIVVVQGLVILFAGALEHLFRAPLVALFSPRAASPAAATA